MSSQWNSIPNGPQPSTPPRLEAEEPRPCIIQVYRRFLQRWATVAKLVRVWGVWAVGIVYRHRQRLDLEVSLPAVVLEWAARRGAVVIIVRFDAERRAVYLPLADALRCGRWKPLDGQDELWIPLDVFRPTGWVRWPYLTEVVRLGPGPEEEALWPL